MSINLSACRFDAKEAKNAMLWYYDAFTNSSNKPYKFIVWCYNLTMKALKFSMDGNERRRLEQHAQYLHHYVKMGE